MKKIFTAKKCILLILCFVFATMLFSCASMKEYTATFVADGVTVSTETFKTEDTSITVPTVPAKDGYTAKWESYTLSANDIVIHAEYTPITYTATFEVDDVVFGYDVFTMDNKTVTLPDVPNKEGYTGTWENYTLTASDIVIGAVYTPITYTATFVVDGETIGTDTFTVEDLTVTPPAIPSKDGYTSVWEGYTLTASDITIAPQYTPVIYTATFVANGDKVGKTTFTVEDLSIECPSVPNKDGYTGAWEAYTITASDTVIEAEYTPII